MALHNDNTQYLRTGKLSKLCIFYYLKAPEYYWHWNYKYI